MDIRNYWKNANKSAIRNIIGYSLATLNPAVNLEKLDDEHGLGPVLGFCHNFVEAQTFHILL